MTVLFLLLLLILVGCQEKEEPEYGEWDGNYIYTGNSRVKTDGTESEELVASFFDGKREYPIKKGSVVGESTFIGDYILLTVQYTPENAEGDNSFVPQALLIYDIRKKSNFYVLTTDEEGAYCKSFFIRYVRDDFFVVGRRTANSGEHYTVVNYAGEILNEDDDIYANNVIGDHVFGVYGGYLTFCTLQDRTVKALFEYESDRAHVSHIVGNVYRCGDVIFDPVRRKQIDMKQGEGAIYRVEGEHVIVAEHFQHDAKWSGDNSFGGYQNAVIYKIDSDCCCVPVYSFPLGLSFTSVYSSDEKYLNFYCRRRKALTDAYYSQEKYTFDKQTEQLYKGEATLKGDIEDVYGATDGVKCGKYYYGFKVIRSGIFGVPDMYSLIRYDSETRKTVYMQVNELNTEFGNRPAKFTVKEF